MKIDRLMAITIYLLNHGKTSAQKLSEAFEVSPRTIMRDMDTLGQAGIPIQSSYGVDGGYQIMDTFIMDKQLVNNNDYSVIITALKGLYSAYNNKNIEQILAKVNLLMNEQKNPISIDLSIAHENRVVNTQIQLLEEAINQKRIVQFQYTNNKNETKLLQVEPVSVTYKWYNWYLIGYYEKYQDYVMFKLVRMESLIATDKKNTKEHKLSDIQLAESNENDMIEIKLRGKSHVKVKCKEYLNGKITKEYNNGDFEFCFTVPKRESYWYGVILSMGSDVKIIEPKSVIKRILETCDELIKAYEED